MKKKSEVASSDKIAKLPVWAKDIIYRTTRERDDAVSRLNCYLDSQSPSEFFTEEFCGKEMVKHYIGGHRVSCYHNNIKVTLYCDDDGVDISFGLGENGSDVALLQPRACNVIRIVKPK